MESIRFLWKALDFYMDLNAINHDCIDKFYEISLLQAGFETWLLYSGHKLNQHGYLHSGG